MGWFKETLKRLSQGLRLQDSNRKREELAAAEDLEALTYAEDRQRTIQKRRSALDSPASFQTSANRRACPETSRLLAPPRAEVESARLPPQQGNARDPLILVESGPTGGILHEAPEVQRTDRTQDESFPVQPFHQDLNQAPKAQPTDRLQVDAPEALPAPWFQDHAPEARPARRFQEQAPEPQPAPRFQEQAPEPQPAPRFQEQASEAQPARQLQDEAPKPQSAPWFQHHAPEAQPARQPRDEAPEVLPTDPLQRDGTPTRPAPVQGPAKDGPPELPRTAVQALRPAPVQGLAKDVPPDLPRAPVQALPPEPVPDSDLEDALVLLAVYEDVAGPPAWPDYPEPDWLDLAPSAPEAESAPSRPDLGKVAVERPLDQRQRAELLATHWADQAGWPSVDIPRLARILESCQHGATRAALWRAIREGYSSEALETACLIRAIWLEHPEFMALPGGRPPKGYHPSPCPGWRFSLRLAMTGPGPERLQTYLEELHDEWYSDPRIHRCWKAFEYYVRNDLEANERVMPLRWPRTPGRTKAGSIRITSAGRALTFEIEVG